MKRTGAASGDPAWLRMADRAYAMLLRLYPRPHRERWEQALRQAFRDRCREVARGERGLFALLAESLPDVAAAAAREQAQHAGLAPPLRQHVAFALLLGFAATLWWHEPIADALVFSSEAASNRWNQYQDDRDLAAARAYWADVAHTLESGGPTTRQRSAAALAWIAANQPGHAGDALRKALAAGDPAATWLAAAGCWKREACSSKMGSLDVDGAIARQQAAEPGNAAPALFAFERATAAGDPAAADAALSRAARAGRYRADDGTLLKALLSAGDAARVPRSLLATLRMADPADAADELALDGWHAMALPQFDALRARCRPVADGPVDARCVLVARLLAGSAQPMARATGQRILCRYLCEGPGRSEVASLAADRQWQLDHQDYSDPAWRVAWLRAWRADDVHGEIDADRRVLRSRGLRDSAPPGYRPPPRLLDPAR